jgi:hypothetical protein
MSVWGERGFLSVSEFISFAEAKVKILIGMKSFRLNAVAPHRIGLGGSFSYCHVGRVPMRGNEERRNLNERSDCTAKIQAGIDGQIASTRSY